MALLWLFQTSPERYETDDEIHVVKREHGLTPNGNPLNGKWVYRKNGEFIDYDQYRNDLFERLNLFYPVHNAYLEK